MTPKPTTAAGLVRHATKAAHRIAVMHQRHGAGPDGKQCRQCHSLRRYPSGARQDTFYKCRLFGDTRSATTDWQARYPACGAFTIADPDRETP